MSRSAATTCSHCNRGPSGIAGHDELFSQTMSPPEMQFKCRACSQAWARRERADHAYSWVPIGKFAGIDVPGRPGTTPP